jgi:hypothetical protein
LQSAYTAAALIPVIVVYALAYRIVSHSTKPPGFFSWVTAHSPDSGFSFNPLTSALLSVRGTLRLFFGGKLSDFLRDGISKGALLALLLATIVFCVCAWHAARDFRMPRPANESLVWTVVYVAFLFFWMPQNTFYRLFYLPPLIAILFTTLRPASTVKLFVPILLIWNFAFAIYPQSRTKLNAPLAFALAERSHWPPGTRILYDRFHPDLWTISYFNPQAAWIWLPDTDPDRLLEQGPLWLEETAYERIASSSSGRQWLAAHEQSGQLIQYTDPKHTFRFHCMR